MSFESLASVSGTWAAALVGVAAVSVGKEAGRTVGALLVGPTGCLGYASWLACNNDSDANSMMAIGGVLAFITLLILYFYNRQSHPFLE